MSARFYSTTRSSYNPPSASSERCVFPSADIRFLVLEVNRVISSWVCSRFRTPFVSPSIFALVRLRGRVRIVVVLCSSAVGLFQEFTYRGSEKGLDTNTKACDLPKETPNNNISSPVNVQASG